MEPYYFFEEELTAKLHNNFIHKYDMDSFAAAELAIEIIEIMKISNSNFTELNNLYLQ